MEFHFSGPPKTRSEMAGRVELLLARDRANEARHVLKKIEHMSPALASDRAHARSLVKRLKREAEAGQRGGWRLFKTVQKAARECGLLARVYVDRR